MQLGGDPQPLLLELVLGAPHQALLLALGLADAAREDGGERQLGRGEGQQDEQQDGQEGAPDLARAGLDAAGPAVGLDGHDLAARRLHRHVDLDEAALAALEAVLRVGRGR